MRLNSSSLLHSWPCKFHARAVSTSVYASTCTYVFHFQKPNIHFIETTALIVHEGMPQPLYCKQSLCVRKTYCLDKYTTLVCHFELCFGSKKGMLVATAGPSPQTCIILCSVRVVGSKISQFEPFFSIALQLSEPVQYQLRTFFENFPFCASPLFIFLPAMKKYNTVALAPCRAS